MAGFWMLSLTLLATPQAPNVMTHVGVSGGLFAGSALLGGFKGSLVTPFPQCRLDASGACDTVALPAMDRWVVGRSSPGWATLSDVSQAVGIAAPGVALLTLSLATRGAAGQQAGETDPLWDMLVWTDTMAVCAFTNQVLKLSVHRPRPVNYLRATRSSEAQVSFPSGHAYAVATGTAAFSTLFWQRYPHSPWRWVVTSTGAALTGLTGIGRIEAGKHFPSDVLAGWALGTALGTLQPTLMRHGLSLSVQGGQEGQPRTLNVQGQF